MRIKDIQKKLLNLEKDVFIIKKGKNYIAKNSRDKNEKIIAFSKALPCEALGNKEFQETYKTNFSYYAGAMANGIASEKMVTTLSKNGFLASFGSGGLVPEKIENAIINIKKTLKKKSFAFNFLHSPNEPEIEKKTIELYLKYDVNIIEAAAFLTLNLNLIHYRAKNLTLNKNGDINIKNRIIAKVSREELAEKFMRPAPLKLLKEAVQKNLITEKEAKLAEKIPVADDITIEADSGGHTDNRPLVAILPSVIFLRDKIEQEYNFKNRIRIGAAGGISTPASALAAFIMQADYIVTGSVNQSCIESGASEHTKKLLSTAGIADFAMAPAADMFEIGAKLQVLKRGTLFPVRANKLYQLYTRYNSIDEIPELERIETQIFKNRLENVWEITKNYFEKRDTKQIELAENNPKRKMALIFRWYLGLSSLWSNEGIKERIMDYQIWAGPSLGAFNSFVYGTPLQNYKNRKVVDVAKHILKGAAFLYRINELKFQKIELNETEKNYPLT